MKFIVFNGSPAGTNSNTNVIAEAFLEGAKDAGAEVENVYLIDKNIGHCKGCFACWFKTPGRCVMNDDMTELLDKYNNADVICFATPVYTWNMTAALKNFIDRLAPLKSPLLVQNNGNFDLADSEVKTQQFMVISNCGFPGDHNFDTIRLVFASCNPVLEIYRNCGKLLKSKVEEHQNIVALYLQAVRAAGYEMAANRSVSGATKEKLDMQLMSVQEYCKYIGM